MAERTMVAVGIPCPRCRQAERHEILELSGPLRLRLRCLSCEAVWWEEL